MAGSGDAYRIERLYLDRDQTYRAVGVRLKTAGARNEPVHRSRRPVPRSGAYDGFTGARRVGARFRQQSVMICCGTPATTKRDDLDIHQDTVNRRAVPDAKVALRELIEHAKGEGP